MQRPRTLVLDSGIGGLSVLIKLMRQFPQKIFYYIADTFYFPYGEKTAEKLCSRLRYLLDGFIQRRQIDSIVLACHTAAAAAARDMFDDYALPIYGIADPLLTYIQQQAEQEKEKGGKLTISLLGTQALIDSQFYQKNLASLDITASFHSCSDLVLYVESGVLSGEGLEDRIARHLSHLPVCQVNIPYRQVALACTHFPFLSPLFEKIGNTLTPPLHFLDPADYLIDKLKGEKVFQTSPLPKDWNKNDILSMYTTDRTAAFEYKMRRMMQEAYHAHFDDYTVGRFEDL